MDLQHTELPNSWIPVAPTGLDLGLAYILWVWTFQGDSADTDGRLDLPIRRILLLMLGCDHVPRAF